MLNIRVPIINEPDLTLNKSMLLQYHLNFNVYLQVHYGELRHSITVLSSNTTSRGQRQTMFHTPSLLCLHLSLRERIVQCLPVGTLCHINTTIELGFLGIFTSIHVGTGGDGEALSMKGGGGVLPSDPASQSDGAGWGNRGLSLSQAPALLILKCDTIYHLLEGTLCCEGRELNWKPEAWAFILQPFISSFNLSSLCLHFFPL